jgi:hypothetical protein
MGAETEKGLLTGESGEQPSPSRSGGALVEPDYNSAVDQHYQKTGVKKPPKLDHWVDKSD